MDQLFKYPTVNGSWTNYAREYKSIEAFENQRDVFLKQIEDYVLSLEETKNKNLEIIEHNKNVISHIKNFMSQIGIPASYYWTDPSSRARNPKSQSKPAGYLEDIQRNIKTTDYTYTQLIQNAESSKKKIQAYVDSQRAEIIAAEQALKASEKEKKKNLFVSTMKVKYDLPFDASEWEIRGAILEKNKYLKLAHYLLLNRLDWNDGYDYAETGLNSFKVETEQDQEIFDDISRCIDSAEDGIDGRIFRDTKWNYDELFAIVDDQSLLEDYNTYQELCQNEY